MLSLDSLDCFELGDAGKYVMTETLNAIYATKRHAMPPPPSVESCRYLSVPCDSMTVKEPSEEEMVEIERALEVEAARDRETVRVTRQK